MARNRLCLFSLCWRGERPKLRWKRNYRGALASPNDLIFPLTLPATRSRPSDTSSLWFPALIVSRIYVRRSDSFRADPTGGQSATGTSNGYVCGPFNFYRGTPILVRQTLQFVGQTIRFRLLDLNFAFDPWETTNPCAKQRGPRSTTRCNVRVSLCKLSVPSNNVLSPLYDRIYRSTTKDIINW